MTLASPDGLCKSGWLKQKSGLFWSKRYVELHQTELYVRKSDKAKKMSVRLVITAATEVGVQEKKNKRILVISLGDGKSLKLKAGTDAELDEWILALRSATFHNSILSMESFEIVRVLGRGFFGKVMLVAQKDTQELFAIKTVHKMRLLQSQKVHTILAERNIMRRIEHPFIVNLLFAFQSATKFYLGLEYIAGGELLGLMRKTPVMPISQVRLYVAELALAIEHLHRHGIVYRDIKPENILIAPDGHLKLTDFGLSKDISNTKSTGSFCGTAEFMPPEIVEKKFYTFSVDWWALGVLMYEMLFGRNPFHDENRAKMFSKICTRQPVFPGNVDPDVKDFIMKLLAKNPADRGSLRKLKDHPFWNGLNFSDVLAKKITPEFIPTITDPRAASNFDTEFTQELAVDSIATPPLGDKNVFTNFSFMGALDDGFDDDEVPQKKDFPIASQRTID